MLAEMVARGNRVAGFYREELELLENHLRELASDTVNLDFAGAGPASIGHSHSHSHSYSEGTTRGFESMGFGADGAGGSGMQDWGFDDGVIDGERLMRAAEGLDVGAFQWYGDDGVGGFEGLDASLL